MAWNIKRTLILGMVVTVARTDVGFLRCAASCSALSCRR